MGGYNLNQESIMTALHADADSYAPPVDLKQKIDARIARQEKEEAVRMKKLHVKKIVAAAALACAMTGTVCMAAGKISLYYSSTLPLTEITDFTDLAKLEKKADIKVHAPEMFDNGFAFADAAMIDTKGVDARDNEVTRQKEVSIHYKKGEQNIQYTSCNQSYTPEDSERTQTIESEGVDYYFHQASYLFVPPGYEPTEDELSAQEAGELFISEGSQTREEKICESLTWNVDGQGYMLLGMDLNMGAEELLKMAEQIK